MSLRDRFNNALHNTVTQMDATVNPVPIPVVHVPIPATSLQMNNVPQPVPVVPYPPVAVVAPVNSTQMVAHAGIGLWQKYKLFIIIGFAVGGILVGYVGWRWWSNRNKANPRYAVGIDNLLENTGMLASPETPLAQRLPALASRPKPPIRSAPPGQPGGRQRPIRPVQDRQPSEQPVQYEETADEDPNFTKF